MKRRRKFEGEPDFTATQGLKNLAGRNDLRSYERRLVLSLAERKTEYNDTDHKQPPRVTGERDETPPRKRRGDGGGRGEERK